MLNQVERVCNLLEELRAHLLHNIVQVGGHTDSWGYLSCFQYKHCSRYRDFYFIQYIAGNWPWYSLRGLHIRNHFVFLIWYPYFLVFLIWYPYALVSLYGNTAHCSGCGVVMGCNGLSIVPRTAVVASQWYDCYCFVEYTRTWARHPTTLWQRECTAITDFQLIDSL